MQLSEAEHESVLQATDNESEAEHNSDTDNDTQNNQMESETERERFFEKISEVYSDPLHIDFDENVGDITAKELRELNKFTSDSESF